jgi:hypothetical protein
MSQRKKTNDEASQRAKDEWRDLNEAFIANQNGRDAFLAVAHTALFAASISFVGDVVKDHELQFVWLIISSWAVGVVGLVSLVASYASAQHEIGKRREAIFHDTHSNYNLTSKLNKMALYSFPIVLFLTFAFAACNVFNMSDENKQIQVLVEKGIQPAPRMPSQPTPNTGVVPAPQMPSAPPPAKPSK